MEIPNYTDLLYKVSYIESILRTIESENDMMPLELLLRDPEKTEILFRYFHFPSSEDFLDAFSKGKKEFDAILDVNLLGERLLFHANKNRSDHTWPNCHIIHCIRGSVAVYVQSEKYDLCEGDTCIIAANTPHSYYDLSEHTITLHSILSPVFIHETLLPRLPHDNPAYSILGDIVLNVRTQPVHIVRSFGNIAETAYFFSSAFYYHLYRPPFYEETINSYMILFFIQLMRSMCNDPELSSTISTTVRQLKQIKSYISANCHSVTLQDLAREFNFNESYLSQYLKKSTGNTFTELLQESRLSLAEKMLINTNLSVVDIAGKVGYQNMSYFYKLFKKVHDCSPAEYRVNHLQSTQSDSSFKDE